MHSQIFNDLLILQRYTNVSEDSEYANFMRRSKELYEDALASLPNPDPPREFQGNNMNQHRIVFFGLYHSI